MRRFQFLLLFAVCAATVSAEILRVNTVGAGPDGVGLRIEGEEFWNGLGSGDDSMDFDLGEGVTETTLYWAEWDPVLEDMVEVGSYTGVTSGIWQLYVPTWSLAFVDSLPDEGASSGSPDWFLSSHFFAGWALAWTFVGPWWVYRFGKRTFSNAVE